MRLLLSLIFLSSFSYAAELTQKWTTEFVGSLDGTKQIRLLIYRDKDDTAFGSYFNTEELKRYHIKGYVRDNKVLFNEIEGEEKVASFKGELTGDKKPVLTGTYKKNGESYKAKLNYFIHFPARPGRNLYAPIEADNTEEVEAFATGFKKNLLAGNKEEVIKNLHHRIYVHIDGKGVWLEAKDYMENYDKIFHPEFIESVKKNSFPMNMINSYKGVWFGFNRELIIQKTRKGDGPFRLRVAEINNQPKEKE